MEENERYKSYRKSARDVLFKFGVFKSNEKLNSVKKEARDYRNIFLNLHDTYTAEQIKFGTDVCDAITAVVSKACVNKIEVKIARRNSI